MSNIEFMLKDMVVKTIHNEVFPECKKMKNAMQVLHKKLCEVQSVNKYLHTRIESLNVDLTEARASLVDVQCKLAASDKSISMLQDENDDLQGLNDDLQGLNDDLQGLNDDLQFGMDEIANISNGYTADEPAFWDKLVEGVDPESPIAKRTKKKARYSKWDDRMRDLFALGDKLIWIGDTMQIPRTEVENMFPHGKSMFQFQRCYGKKADNLRFNVEYTKDMVQLTHRTFTKVQLESLYGV
ncbi:MAG: hypothetical protein CMO44_07700 [Verrucomicrobiales bacterium]|nr:hypothetical protein [Verrucomicrobiales bacterium]